MHTWTDHAHAAAVALTPCMGLTRSNSTNHTCMTAIHHSDMQQTTRTARTALPHASSKANMHGTNSWQIHSLGPAKNSLHMQNCDTAGLTHAIHMQNLQSLRTPCSGHMQTAEQNHDSFGQHLIRTALTNHAADHSHMTAGKSFGQQLPQQLTFGQQHHMDSLHMQ
ncbi:hypothetical protein I3843_12G001700 [Carya illinoinensis]|nr:hypothetical protein I3843_12G001700 [Carya illinoinensis]